MHYDWHVTHGSMTGRETNFSSQPTVLFFCIASALWDKIYLCVANQSSRSCWFVESKLQLKGARLTIRSQHLLDGVGDVGCLLIHHELHTFGADKLHILLSDLPHFHAKLETSIKLLTWISMHPGLNTVDWLDVYQVIQTNSSSPPDLL